MGARGAPTQGVRLAAGTWDTGRWRKRIPNGRTVDNEERFKPGAGEKWVTLHQASPRQGERFAGFAAG